jgi:hypothetical protein
MRLISDMVLGLAVCLPAIGWANNTTVHAVQPFPRAVIETKRLHVWSFQTDAAGWRATHHCKLDAANGALRIECTGNDPCLFSGPVKVEAPVTVKMTAKCSTDGHGEFFWTTTELPHTTPEESVQFNLIHDGQWHDYAVPLAVAGTLTRLRLDPGSAPGLVEVRSIELTRETLHPLEVQALRSSGREVEAVLKNHGAAPIPVSVGGRKAVVPAGGAQPVSFTAPGAAPFGDCPLVVEPENLPAIRRPVFLCDGNAAGDWVDLKSKDLTVRVARDGTGARLEPGGRLAGFIAPLVSREGVALKLKLARSGSALRFIGDGVTVDIGLRRDEVTVAIKGGQPCEGPVLRALGPLEQGVFAGLEHLGKGESSSSTLDIETKEHIRYAPDPLKVTMPLMAFVTDRAAAAITWRDMSLQPVYATPNFLDGAEGHRAALRGKNIEATIRVRPAERLEDTILWAVKRRGLPPLPKPPRNPQAQMEFCLRTLSGPPLKTGAGWGHCAESHWGRQPFADIASVVWRLTGRAPALPKLVPGGGHVHNDAIYFATGRVEEWLRMRTGEAKRILGEQKPDGSFRYHGKYQRGHFEDTASGYCARPAATLLEHARCTGDKDALAAGVKALEFMKRFRTPRGAQTWECPLHTPDVLGSACLVHAYVRGYELTGDTTYLACARRWAISGLPFIYQWSRHPVMAYATIAVLGATNWRAPNWIGLPVQWCGHVYAHALMMLAPYDKTLDWKRLAEGIQIAAEQMQYPDGEFAGCLPDSFDLASQQRRPWNINPTALVNLRLLLDGKLDSLAVAAAGPHRIVAPHPIAIRDGRAVIRAQEGTAYQVLVDGHRVVNVQSRGVDTVPLD